VIFGEVHDPDFDFTGRLKTNTMICRRLQRHVGGLIAMGKFFRGARGVLSAERAMAQLDSGPDFILNRAINPGSQMIWCDG
jgi:hypothetical protein